MVALAFFLSLVFWPGISGGATTPRWALLSCVTPIVLLFRPTPWTTAHVVGLVFVLWCGITLLWTPNLAFGLNAYWQIILMAVVFALGSSTVTLRPVLIALGIGFGLNSALVLMQGLYWDPFKYLVTPGNPSIVGTYINGNLLAECAALTFIGCTAHRLWWTLPGLVPSIIQPWTNGTPRAPLLALGAALVVYVWRWRPLWAVHLGTLGIGIGLVVIGGQGHNDSLGQRLSMWQDTIHGLTFWGHGIGSFYLTFPEYADHFNTLVSRPENAHNDYLEYIYELGVGSVLLVYLVGIGLRTTRQAELYMLVGALVLSALGFPLHMPVGQFMAALILGAACSTWLPLRCTVALGRIRVLAWLARIQGSYRVGLSSTPSGDIFWRFSTVLARSCQLLRRRSLARIGTNSDQGNS